MDIIFTICSNNYLAQATVLGRSLTAQSSTAKFFIFLCDQKVSYVDYNDIADEIIPIADIEPGIVGLAIKYNIIELNTCVKPRVFEYLFTERNAQKVIYLDPDIKVFSPFTDLFAELDSAAIILTPHIFSPIPLDGKKPSEGLFQNFGLYNLGFLGMKQDEEALKLVQWWLERTYVQGFIDKCNGIFVDQLPMIHVPLFFKGVKILGDMGYNMAPWNIHERWLSFVDDRYWVNGDTLLKFYHFSSFQPDSNELPLVHYDRYLLRERKDLQEIHDRYNEEVKLAGFAFFNQIKSWYSLMHEKAKRGRM